ncbi:MAG TPA: hypothetical protein EYH12_02270 [Psychromonas hadalis]|nr:hypothetical protein [Psychromonas hadalis]
MRYLKVLPAIFSLVILVAHFLREGSELLPQIILLVPVLMLIKVKRKEITLFLQAVLGISALLWLDTAYDILVIRLSRGIDWMRMVLILSSVALFSLFSAYLLKNKSLER